MCPITINCNTIELTVHTSCYCLQLTVLKWKIFSLQKIHNRVNDYTNKWQCKSLMTNAFNVWITWKNYYFFFNVNIFTMKINDKTKIKMVSVVPSTVYRQLIHFHLSVYSANYVSCFIICRFCAIFSISFDSHTISDNNDSSFSIQLKIIILNKSWLVK